MSLSITKKTYKYVGTSRPPLAKKECLSPQIEGGGSENGGHQIVSKRKT